MLNYKRKKDLCINQLIYKIQLAHYIIAFVTRKMGFYMERAKVIVLKEDDNGLNILLSINRITCKNETLYY